MGISPTTARFSAQLRTAWMLASAREPGNPFIIPTSTKNDAVQLRFKLYNVVKPVRDGRMVDEQLVDAISRVKIGIAELEPGRGRWGVVLARKMEEHDLAAALAGVGVEESTIASAPVPVPVEPPAPDFAGLFAKLDSEAPKPAGEGPFDPFVTKNPFYSRAGDGSVK